MKISWGAIITFISLLIITVSALVGIFTILNILFTLPLLVDVVLTAIIGCGLPTLSFVMILIEEGKHE